MNREVKGAERGREGEETQKGDCESGTKEGGKEGRQKGKDRREGKFRKSSSTI